MPCRGGADGGGRLVRLDGGPDADVDRIDVLVDNEVAASASRPPFSLTLATMPDRPHVVRVRVRYQAGTQNGIVESPHVRNPWWPYGGPPGR